MSRYFVKINSDKSNDFFTVDSDTIPENVSSIALEVSKDDIDKYWSNNGKYRFVKSDSATPIAVLEEIDTINEALIKSITDLNTVALSKIKEKETYYTACLTSSLYTDAEMAIILAQTKADKLTIVQDLQKAQEAILNG